MSSVFTLRFPSVAPVDEIQMKPRLMMATLISWSEAKSSLSDASCMRTFKYRSEPGGLRNPQTSVQLFGIDPGLKNGAGPGGEGKAQSVKASSIVLMLSFAAVPPRSTIEVTCNQVNFLRDHDELLGDAFLLGGDVADMYKESTVK